MENTQETSVNIAEIMDGIRAEIQERGYSSEMLSFTDVPNDNELLEKSDRFDADLFRSNIRFLEDYAPLETPDISDSAFLRKYVLQQTEEYMQDLLEHQSEWNECTARVQKQVEQFIQDTRQHDNSALLKKIEVLELQQKELRIENGELRKTLAKIQEQLDGLSGTGATTEVTEETKA